MLDGSLLWYYVRASVEEPGTVVFAPAAGKLAVSVRHSCVQEVWFVPFGKDRFARAEDGETLIIGVNPVVPLSIRRRTGFPFRTGLEGPFNHRRSHVRPGQRDVDRELVACVPDWAYILGIHSRV